MFHCRNCQRQHEVNYPKEKLSILPEPLSLSLFKNRTPIGYGITFNGYSTWRGLTLKLKDLYVRDGYRHLGVGRKLITAIAEYAKEVNAARLYFHVREWNTAARKFYESTGATNWTELEEWALLRFDKNAIDDLVRNKNRK